MIDGPPLSILEIHLSKNLPSCILNSLRPSDAYMLQWFRKITSIGSDNSLSPGRRQAIIWTNADILWIKPPGT